MSDLASKGYTPCVYIESSGTQYIDTGFIPNQDTRVVIECEFQIMGTNVYLYGAQESASSKTFGFRAYNTYYRTHYDNGSTGYSASVSYTGKFEIDQNKNVTTLQGEHAVSRTYNSFECPNSLTLCGANQGGTIIGKSICKIYSCKIYDNGSLIRDYEPCVTDGGVFGLYDKVNNLFYSSPTDNFRGQIAVSQSTKFRRRIFESSVKPKAQFDYSKYLTIEAIEGPVLVSLNDEGMCGGGNTLEYCVDGNGEWNKFRFHSEFTIQQGQKVSMRGYIVPDTDMGIGCGHFQFRTGTVAVSGDPRSLMYGDEAENGVLTQYCFASMFSYNNNLLDVSNVLLPCTELAANCYEYMFRSCTSIEVSPELPAPYFARGCYNYMFAGCSNLSRISAYFVQEPNSMYTNSWVQGVSDTGIFVVGTDVAYDYHTCKGIHGIPEYWMVL